MKHNYQKPGMELLFTEAEDVLTTSTSGGEIGNVSKEDSIDWNL